MSVPPDWDGRTGRAHGDVRYDRACSFFVATARLRAERVVEPGDGLVGVLDPTYPLSYEHNRVIVTEPVRAERLVAWVDQLMGGAGLMHREVHVYADPPEATVGALRAAGYDHRVLVVMTGEPGRLRTRSGAVRVESVREVEVAPLVARLWREEYDPALSDEAVRQLVARRERLDRSGLVHRLVVRDPDDGHPVASADLVVGSAGVAELDGVGVLPTHRGRGYGDALVAEAVRRAVASGVEQVVLQALGDDWPRGWYARRGWAEVGRVHEFSRQPSDRRPAEV
ncbi:MAG: GNAT family N-acetyltransferase [Actinomycetes bacterium]